MAHSDKADFFKLQFEYDQEQEETDNKTYTVDSIEEVNKEDLSISVERDVISAGNDSKHTGYSMLWEEGGGGQNNTGRSGSIASSTSGQFAGAEGSGAASRSNPFHSSGVGGSAFGKRTNGVTSNGVQSTSSGRMPVKEEVHRYSNTPGQGSTQKKHVQNEPKGASQNALNADYTYNKVPSRSAPSVASPGPAPRRAMPPTRQTMEDGEGRVSSERNHVMPNRALENNNFEASPGPVPRRAMPPTRLTMEDGEGRVPSERNHVMSNRASENNNFDASPGPAPRRAMPPTRQTMEDGEGRVPSERNHVLSNRASENNNFEPPSQNVPPMRQSSLHNGAVSPIPQQRASQLQRKLSTETSSGRETESDTPITPRSSDDSRRPNDNMNAAQVSEKTTEASEKEKKMIEKLGTPVYQIEVRFIVYKGLRFCGGIRVLLNCPEEVAYLQLITLQDEVFVTYDINNICFLEPRSAAGVSFCGVPYNPLKENQYHDDYPETDISATEPTDATERKRQRCREKKARMSVIDHAEVVFCTPEQTMRFKTVIDTLLCAVACEDSSVPPQSLADMGGTMAGPCHDRTEGVPFGDGKRTQCNAPASMIYPQSMKQHEPVTEQYGSIVKSKYGLIQSFDPCPRGPVSTSMCLPCDLGDPYQLNPDEGRVVFCTPACLKVCCRNGEKMVYKGKLKIVQGTGGIGFVIRIESTDGTTLYCHSLRRDLILYETNDVQYGFCYSTVVCTAGRTSMETFVVAFPSSYQCDQFKHAINTCKEILGMTSVQSLINVNRT